MTPSKMTQEQMRIAVAEARPELFKIIHGKVYWRDDRGLVNVDEDLNACAAFRQKLTLTQYRRFIENLLGICRRNHPERIWDWSNEMMIGNSTAAEQTEAFLSTIHPQKAEVGE